MRKLTALLLMFALLIGASGALAQTEEPTAVPTEEPTTVPDVTETLVPTLEPTLEPTAEPTGEITVEPTEETTTEITFTPTFTPTPTATATGIVITATFSPTLAVTPAAVLPKLDSTPRLAVMSAFAPEITLLLAQTAVENTFSVNGVQFTTGQLAGNEVVLFLSGVSIVNAAMTTQLAIDHFNITHILFSGIAGGVNPAFHVGDVVIAAQWGNYQEAFAARQQPDGTFAAPANPPFPPFGFMFPQNVHVTTSANPAGEDKFWFAVDPQMLSVAGTVASAVQLANCTSANVCLTDAPVVHVGGSGVSGPTFVDNAAYREYVYNTFQADALDMETAAALMVAYANGVPFLAFRSLSDLAGGGPGANEIGTFFQLAADNSASVTIAFLNAWASQ